MRAARIRHLIALHSTDLGTDGIDGNYLTSYAEAPFYRFVHAHPDFDTAPFRAFVRGHLRAGEGLGTASRDNILHLARTYRDRSPSSPRH